MLRGRGFAEEGRDRQREVLKKSTEMFVVIRNMKFVGDFERGHLCGVRRADPQQ